MSTAKKLRLEEAPPPEFSSPVIFSHAWDALLVGGISLLVYLLVRATMKAEAPDNPASLFVYNLSFLVNFPHFLISYQLLYGDFRAELRKSFRFIWAAFISPAVIGGALLAGYLMHSEKFLGYSLNAMYFFVGWHYVKQIFGCVVVTNAMKNVFYNEEERFIVKANLFAVWAVSFLNPNIVTRVYEQMGIHYASLELPVWTMNAAYAVLIASGIGVVWAHVKKYIREGSLPSTPAVISYLSIYVWFVPTMLNPNFGNMIPFFHSLQYLVFVYAFRRNKMAILTEGQQTPEGRQKRLIGVWGYFLGACILGATAFEFLPRGLDSLHMTDLGPTPAVFFFTIFINIHHYFIDNVLWRGNNPQMRQYLFARR
jgi:hypothetical protein